VTFCVARFSVLVEAVDVVDVDVDVDVESPSPVAHPLMGKATTPIPRTMP